MKDTIHTAITGALAKLGANDVAFVVERPADMAHGDYASNAAMVAAKQLDLSPREVATALEQTLTGNIPDVASITIAGPGFLNFTLTRKHHTSTLNTIIETANDWGRNTHEAGEVVLIEYTSPNLFKPLHIGNLVGNIVGESITRLFEFSGAEVKRMNYPSDIGLTVAKGVWGLINSNGDPQDITSLGNAYRIGNEAYEAGGSEKEAIEAVNRSLYARDNEELNILRDTAIATSKRHLRQLCAVLGTSFDAEITESEASGPGTEIVKSHEGTVFTRSEGAVVFEGERVGLHTRVFLNSQGLPTYEAKDVGHFTLKEARYPEWTQSIVVTGKEQSEYFKVLYAALRELFASARERRLEHIPTGFLTLTTGKMSSRKGNVLTGESLLEELKEAAHQQATVTQEQLDTLTDQVAVAALKYQILRHSIGSDIVFDKEKALSFEGDSGPYLQYTYARIGSVLEKALAASIANTTHPAPTVPYPVERMLAYFPDVIETAQAERAPQKLVSCLTELASAFNSFYAQEKIADPSDEYAPYKVTLAKAVQQTLKNGLWVLGIKAPERM